MNPSKQMVDKMGYDRSITMFSPDGRLLQVEYAKKTVKQGSTAIGIVCKNGVVLLTDKRIASKLIVSGAIEKTFKVDGKKVSAGAYGSSTSANKVIEVDASLITQAYDEATKKAANELFIGEEKDEP